ncbi:head fiber protein [Alkalihalophilus marmarensis]|jgi:hypothetical protein|uniref:head fiber protein n=1 Tax=Alkalihalophilus marmarensis TaxID=521377 RepID=UPI00203D2504|nr:head fiber protein [Alkalihalophilus marmarensis]MCM3487897.1 head fiber protein [Alkalihalophilus marmarensis]
MANSFKAVVNSDIKPNRLLSRTESTTGVTAIDVTAVGGTPDFRSTGNLEAGQVVTVTIKNDPIWVVEAGESIEVGIHVAVGEEGKVVATNEHGIGYLAESVEAGGLARVIRQTGHSGQSEQGPQGPPGERGPAGPKGAKGDKGDPGENPFTEDEVTKLRALITDGE